MKWKGMSQVAVENGKRDARIGYDEVTHACVAALIGLREQLTTIRTEGIHVLRLTSEGTNPEMSMHSFNISSLT